jgi:hypothetical protein
MATGQMVGQPNSAEFISQAQAQVSLAAAEASASAASAAAAAASEGLATGAASAAEAERVLAETAADSAQNASGTYADTTAGLAATASGGYFYVPTGDGGLVRYLDNAGTAVEVGRVAAGAVVQELVASVPPRSTDTAGDLDVVVDAVGNVYRRTTADGGLMLAGRDESVQTRLDVLDAFQVQTDTSGWQDFGFDSLGRTTRATDSAGGLRLPGRTEAVQTSLARLEAQADALYRPSGGVVLPSGFTPMTKALRPQERYIWATMPAALRPNPLAVNVWAYPFEWQTQDQVLPSMMRRRKGTLILAANTYERIRWDAEETITVNAPAGFFTPGVYPNGRQFRDGAHMYDRATGKFYFAICGISGTADGWKNMSIQVFESSDGLVWDFLAESPNMGSGNIFSDRAITPDWLVDSDGTLYVTICGYEASLVNFNTWIWRVNDPGAFSSWTKMGQVTGSALPTLNANGAPFVIDTCSFTRDGVYYLVWKAEAENGLGSHTKAQIGLAWSTSLLGPYNSGTSFFAPTGENLKGEGLCVIELPPGSPYRFRLFWDNYLGTTYGGKTSPHMCADTNDFQTFTPPVPTGFDTTSSSIYERNTVFGVGYP